MFNDLGWKGESMNVLRIHGSKGISGNSLIGGALSLGMPLSLLEESCSKVPGLEKVKFVEESYKINDREIFYFNTEPGNDEEKLDGCFIGDVLKMLSESSLDASLKSHTKKIIWALFESKADAHQMAIEEVQFRYEGLVDTLVDSLGAALILSYFSADSFSISGPIETGSGLMTLPHKVLTIPVPMVTYLLKDLTWQEGSYQGEKVTPTGAAILKVFGSENSKSSEGTHRVMGYSYPIIPYDHEDCFILELIRD